MNTFWKLLTAKSPPPPTPSMVFFSWGGLSLCCRYKQHLVEYTGPEIVFLVHHKPPRPRLTILWCNIWQVVWFTSQSLPYWTHLTPWTPPTNSNRLFRRGFSPSSLLFPSRNPKTSPPSIYHFAQKISRFQKYSARRYGVWGGVCPIRYSKREGGIRNQKYDFRACIFNEMLFVPKNFPQGIYTSVIFLETRASFSSFWKKHSDFLCFLDLRSRMVKIAK